MNSFNDIRSERPDALSLTQLNRLVKTALDEALPGTYWVRAETSEVRVNATSGHCYLEFVEKDETTGQLVAKSRGTIWARNFAVLRTYFEQETGQTFISGLKVLVNVSVEYHELYGLSLTVHDIDPSYTLGDMARKRMEVIRRLQEEGVFDLNKELTLAILPQRIAVISSPTAAGYEDFVNQLIHNDYGFPFYVKLFPALMQGEKTEESVIAALDRIYAHRELFDVVVLIRGGGSAADLSSFDSYTLAANCAQFPLPIITGIGHERDDSVVDNVAHTRMKTPTAVAAFLINRMAEQLALLDELRRTVCEATRNQLTVKKTTWQILATRFPVFVTGHLERHRTSLHTLAARLSSVPQLLEKHTEQLEHAPMHIQKAVSAMLTRHTHELALSEQHIKLASPDHILKRGYTLTLKDGKIVKHAADLSAGDEISVRFTDGERKGKILT
ncbi:exodeoxyribonuclease VII, large subunit [Tannerella forsythia 92A2]|uniref:Exodeoxyribonuclease 7 large subunit n=1 Tax=Tannerella forsythia (strain ATCC 43037 / JCM 10827 / CCUG 21028 A / KCTC 5666 / FDC 338) TaxID=203275 RepID=G8UJZ1_TANFA|nr:exodeoxyribonuclease VII large subunit [Tannerella forsythia]AEW20387.1 exodeoxyribonuclease VII, large subunit [Tannerella forsythia 92A2]